MTIFEYITFSKFQKDRLSFLKRNIPPQTTKRQKDVKQTHWVLLRRIPLEKKQVQNSKRQITATETKLPRTLLQKTMNWEDVKWTTLGSAFAESFLCVKNGKKPLRYKVGGTNISNIIYTSNRIDIVTLISLRNLYYYLQCPTLPPRGSFPLTT